MPDGELLLSCFHQHRREGNKVMEQTLLFRSKDGGQTWSGGETLDLLGVRALLGTETDDGFEFDWQHDRLKIDAKTPVGMDQGGGFGPTIQLADGTLVTSFSYRGEDIKTHVEVVRWQLPPQ